eukprot:scaffold164105_cov47-Prasinocladus_malaysianus.AAC.1
MTGYIANYPPDDVVCPLTPFLRPCAQNEPAKGQKSSDNKRVRIDKEALEKLLFTLFEKKDNYNFADLMVRDLTISVQSAWPAVHKYAINKAILCHTLLLMLLRSGVGGLGSVAT